jgi:3'-phosphoadenosine 5'-phosphosulfate sulfotransferase (PAPS reductase)/FAD synthetase
MTDQDRVLVGLSGGINSAAVLLWLIESGVKPKELHLFYAHFLEHSPDTFQFVADLVRYARKHFPDVRVRITKNSIIQYFREQKIIPHPVASPCSKKLKIEPIHRYAFENWITIDLVGYVRHELKRRGSKQGYKEGSQIGFFDLQKNYPIGEFTDDWCFTIVKKHIGWYPAIYDIVDAEGNRVFAHNNCLPCKNMYPKDINAVEQHYPDYHWKAMQLSSELGRYWGRDEAEFYTTFGRFLGQDTTCETCKF